MRLGFDRHPLQREGSVAILGVSLMHLVQAAAMLLFASAIGATSLIALLRAFHALDSPDGQTFLSFCMVLIAVVGAAGALFRVGWARVLLFIPQQFILGVQAGGGVWATVLGAYLDGTVIPAPHIAADQIPFLILFGVHWYAIIKRCRDPDG